MRKINCGSCCLRHAIPVSYTHLDVYKRQLSPQHKPLREEVIRLRQVQNAVDTALRRSCLLYTSSMKPAKIAGNVSPIAALQYTAASTKSSARNCSKMKLSRMSWNNVFRNSKSTTLVFASLFFGLSLFLVVTGLLHGLSPENYVSQWGRCV